MQLSEQNKGFFPSDCRKFLPECDSPFYCVLFIFYRGSVGVTQILLSHLMSLFLRVLMVREGLVPIGKGHVIPVHPGHWGWKMTHFDKVVIYLRRGAK